LPNEKDIIEDTVWHILSNVESPGDFKLWLVYNTPVDMPEIEARLQAMADRVDLPHGRKLAVVRAESSKSKAENINLILPQLTAKYTIVYDADHNPDPESLLLLIEKIERTGVDCVQGSTYIRNLNAGMLARIVDADFFVTHFILFPAQRLLTGNAVFEGSNGMWRTKVLQGSEFDKDMQTEDIDVSIRMLLKQRTIEKCPEARSGELAPANYQALFKQRQRWAIGWDQVSLFHFHDIMKPEVPFSRKISVAWALYSRWLMAFIAFTSAVLLAPVGIAKQCGFLLFLDAGMLESFLFFLPIGIAISWTLEAIFQVHHRGMQSFIQVFYVFLFWLLAPLYITFQCVLITTSLFKIATGRDGGWVVTARATTKQGAGGAKQKSRLEDVQLCTEP
jgi:cellulose synthase/poly-beta-1,6-N-acetylglucosamine synthase-like glycosyltransferase